MTTVGAISVQANAAQGFASTKATKLAHAYTFVSTNLLDPMTRLGQIAQDPQPSAETLISDPASHSFVSE